MKVRSDKWMVFFLVGALFVPWLGLLGCESQNEDETPVPTTMVVTNTVNGVTQTNVVVATNAPPVADEVNEAEAPPPAEVDIAEAPAAPALILLGSWRGIYENQDGRSRLQLHIGTQNEAGVSGQASTGMGDGTCDGSLTGSHLSLFIHFFDDNWMQLEGEVDLESILYVGTWETRNGSTGTFGVSR